MAATTTSEITTGYIEGLVKPSAMARSLNHLQ